MTVVLLGTTEVAAIEFELHEPLDPKWLLGHFRLILRDQPLGDWSDTVSLRSLRGWWEALANCEQARWDERLAGLDAAETLHLLEQAAYDVDAAEDVADAFSRFHVNHLGMSAFDPYVVVLVEPPGTTQWLVWRHVASNDVHEARLPARTLETLASRFMRAIDRYA